MLNYKFLDCLKNMGPVRLKAEMDLKFCPWKIKKISTGLIFFLQTPDELQGRPDDGGGLVEGHQVEAGEGREHDEDGNQVRAKLTALDSLDSAL